MVVKPSFSTSYFQFSLSNITILNLERKPKASHSQITGAGVQIWNYRNSCVIRDEQ